MTVTEQGCAELAERLRDAAKEPFGSYAGEAPETLALAYVADLTAAETILSRLTVEQLAGVISKAKNEWLDQERCTIPHNQFLAQALLNHITAENEVPHDHIR